MHFHTFSSSSARQETAGDSGAANSEATRLEQLAREHGFQKRRRGKLTPELFVRIMTATASVAAKGSFRALAVLGGVLAGCTISKQSMWARMGRHAFEFLGAVLCERLWDAELRPILGGAVRRVLITDSTVIALHPSLHKAFPGSANQCGNQHASCRLQVTMELLGGRMLACAPAPFTRNDQAAAQDVVALLKPGDLLLRDLGYFTLKSLAAIDAQKAFFLSRWRYNTTVLDENDQAIDLLELLRNAAKRGCQRVEFEARLGARDKLPVRVAALRLPEKIAAERRREARQNRDRRLNHSATYYELLGWSIFVTNLPADLLEKLDCSKLYSLRWRIENFFKAWKGNLKPALLAGHATNPWHLRCLLLGHMLALTEFGIQGRFALDAPGADGTPPLSMMKVIDILVLSSRLPHDCPSSQAVERQIQYHGRYEKRKREPLPTRAATVLA